MPVLPDYATRFNAGPTAIGLLFGSFGLSLLTLSVPMGTISDRMGRKRPMIVALLVLAISTLAFAYAQSLTMLFVARMLQGAADALTWIVGFAMIADLYSVDERGRVMGWAMAGSTAGIIIGPVLGGWLYELGGIKLPFLVVAGLAFADAIVFTLVATDTKGSGVATPLREVLSHRTIVITLLIVIAGAATVAMLEPVIPLVYRARFGMGPAAVGTVFAIAASCNTVMHIINGRLSDRWGSRRLMLLGLIGSAFVMPLLNLATDFTTALLTLVPMWAIFSMVVTPSLAYVAEAASAEGVESYGVVYGVYNVSWAVGLIAGPAIGGFLLERVGFGPLTLGWSVLLFATGLALARLR